MEEERIITKEDLKQFQEQNNNLKINRIFEEIINSLPKDLQDEAKLKGFLLKKSNDNNMELVNLIIEVPEATVELRSAILNENPYIICE